MNNKDTTARVMAAAMGLGRALRTKLAPEDGMHMLQVHALGFVEHHPGITMKELASMLCITSPSATAFADRLEKQGLIRRRHDSKNRKLVRLSVTPRGKAILKKKIAEKKTLITGVLRCLPARDQKTLARLLEELLTGCETA